MVGLDKENFDEDIYEERDESIFDNGNM